MKAERFFKVSKDLDFSRVGGLCNRGTNNDF